MMNHLIQHPILIIDNRDSFVFNLVRYLQELRVPVLVREADSLTISDIQELEPDRKSVVLGNSVYLGGRRLI